jgi:hypothetical protein
MTIEYHIRTKISTVVFHFFVNPQEISTKGKQYYGNSNDGSCILRWAFLHSGAEAQFEEFQW